MALGGALGSFSGADDVGDAEVVAALGRQGAVVAAVEVQGLGIGEQAAGCDGLQGRLEQDAVVSVGSVDDPSDRDAGAVGGH